ncbi:hypothetical protein OENI_130070 [Oenococcus oeni]|nr:hypothetical protein OENI_130070 [Oenococcus oeni]
MLPNLSNFSLWNIDFPDLQPSDYVRSIKFINVGINNYQSLLFKLKSVFKRRLNIKNRDSFS